MSLYSRNGQEPILLSLLIRVSPCQLPASLLGCFQRLLSSPSLCPHREPLASNPAFSVRAPPLLVWSGFLLKLYLLPLLRGLRECRTKARTASGCAAVISFMQSRVGSECAYVNVLFVCVCAHMCVCKHVCVCMHVYACTRYVSQDIYFSENKSILTHFYCFS